MVRAARSLTLYLGGQLALSGGPVGTEAALDPRAQVGLPDPDRHAVEEGRDPLVFVPPVGTGQRVSGHQPPLRPEASGEASLLGSPKVTLVKCLGGSFGEESWDSKEKLQTCFPRLNWGLGKDSGPPAVILSPLLLQQQLQSGL